MWKLRRNPIRYPKARRIRRLRFKYGCPPGCYAARLASRLDDLPFTYAIALTAPPGRFLEAWNDWCGILTEWASGPRPEYRGFYLVSLAQHPGGNLHAHILVGNVTRDQVDQAISMWPYVLPEKAVKKVWHRWGALHYLFAQEDRPAVHSEDLSSYCANVIHRSQSDNLDLLAWLTATQISKTASRRGISPSARKRSAKARTAALARWSRPRP